MLTSGRVFLGCGTVVPVCYKGTPSRGFVKERALGGEAGIIDPIEAADFGKLMAYVGLTMEKEKLPPEVEISG